MGKLAVRVPALGWERQIEAGEALVPEMRVTIVACRHCGGHSPTFREEMYS